jgi:hypothetical protein
MLPFLCRLLSLCYCHCHTTQADQLGQNCFFVIDGMLRQTYCRVNNIYLRGFLIAFLP